jgi:hypothetical protein
VTGRGRHCPTKCSSRSLTLQLNFALSEEVTLTKDKEE